MKYTFYSDPSHAWLEVSKGELCLLGIRHRISSCSYVKGDNVYLEEDRDAGIFLDAKKAIGQELTPRNINEIDQEITPIRNYDRYYF